MIVGTARSPNGQPVPIRWVQHAMDILAATGEIEISVETVGHRSAFIGAVLATLPDATSLTNPRRVRLGREGTRTVFTPTATSTTQNR